MKFNGALVIREHKRKVFYEAKWRDATGRQVKRRVGEAWLERDASGEWRPRRGRPDAGCLDEKSAIVEMNRLIAEHASLVAVPSAPAAVSFDELAAAWLHHVEHVDGIKPSTLKSFRYMLGDRARKRGRRRAALPRDCETGAADGGADQALPGTLDECETCVAQCAHEIAGDQDRLRTETIEQRRPQGA